MAFCSCSICRRMMGLRLGRLFFAFCSNWASLGDHKKKSKERVYRNRREKEGEMDQQREEEGKTR